MGSVRLISESLVERLLPMRLALQSVEEAFRWEGEGRVENRSRVRLRGENGLFHVMPASLLPGNAMGLKAYTTFQGRTSFLALLWSAETGELRAIFEADRLGQIRTGAASGVATKYLARSDADVVGCYGSGYQAETQLEAISLVREIRRIQVFSRDALRRERFASTLSERLGIDVVAMDRPEAVARGASILVTITNSRTPVLQGGWIEPGAHVNAAGSNGLDRVELDAGAVLKAGLVVADSREQAKVECGDLAGPVRDGKLRWEGVRELGEIVAGKVPGRRSPDEITLFESQGVAMEDVAVCATLLRRAEAEGAGELISIGE